MKNIIILELLLALLVLLLGESLFDIRKEEFQGGNIKNRLHERYRRRRSF